MIYHYALFFMKILNLNQANIPLIYLKISDRILYKLRFKIINKKINDKRLL